MPRSSWQRYASACRATVWKIFCGPFASPATPRSYSGAVLGKSASTLRHSSKPPDDATRRLRAENARRTTGPRARSLGPNAAALSHAWAMGSTIDRRFEESRPSAAEAFSAGVPKPYARTADGNVARIAEEAALVDLA